eukprot:scaffold68589_cov40-Attheya_sp.AAC.1
MVPPMVGYNNAELHSCRLYGMSIIVDRVHIRPAAAIRIRSAVCVGYNSVPAVPGTLGVNAGYSTDRGNGWG